MISILSTVGRVALESTSAAFQTAARPSQLPAHKQRKGPVIVTPGLVIHTGDQERPGVNSARGIRAADSPKIGRPPFILQPGLNRKQPPIMTLSLNS